MSQSIDVHPSSPQSPQSRCDHCASTAAPQKLASHRGSELYEQTEEQRYDEDWEYETLRCSTCRSISIFRGWVPYRRHGSLSARQVWPRRSQLIPEDHKVAARDCVPQDV